MANANIKAVITAEDKSKAVLSGFAGNVDKTNKNISNSFSKMAKVSAVAIGAAIATAGIAITKNLDNAVKRVDTLNNFPKVLKAMGASFEDAENATDKLSEKLRGLPTPLQDGAAGVQQLVAAGLSVPKATDAFLAMNNALLVAGSNAGDTQIVMDSLTRAISAGSVDASTMQAALSRMPTVMQALQKQTGKSSSELFKMFSNDPQKLIDNLIKLNKKGSGEMASLEQQAKDATSGIGTSWDNMNNAITRGLEKLIRAIGENNIATIITNIGLGIERSITTMITFFGILGRAISSFVSIVQTYLSPSLTNLINIVESKLYPSLVKLYNALQPALIQVLKVLGILIGATLVTAIYILVNALSIVINTFSRLISIVSVTIRYFGNMVGASYNASRAIISSFGSVVAFFSSFPGRIGKAVGGLWGAVAGAFRQLRDNAIQWAREAVNGVVSAFRSIPGEIKNAIGSAGGNAIGGAGKFIKGLNPFADGGYTGQGYANEPAGIVHKGEYVLPKSMVDQSTGKPKSMGGMGGNMNITINAQAFMGSQQDARKFAKMLHDALTDYKTANGMA